MGWLITVNQSFGLNYYLTGESLIDLSSTGCQYE